MMSKPLISIIIPFKDTELFIAECLESVLNQSFENFEIICVNDNSTDMSNKIVLEFSKSESRIKLLKSEGQGIIKALQTGFKSCNGDFITRMDSDDIMTQDRLEFMLNALKSYGNNHIALGLVKYFRSDGLKAGYLKYEKWLNNLTLKGNNFTEIYKECTIPSPCWMLHRDDFIKCGGFNSNRYPEDYDLAFRFYKHKLICIPSNKILHYWRDYDKRTSRIDKHYAENYFLDLKTDYFLELDHNPERPLVIWGAGKKGKKIAQLLLKLNIKFYWICNNRKKIGKHIYEKKLEHYRFLKQLKQPQCLVTVANETEQKAIVSNLHSLQMVCNKDYFLFC